MANRTTKMLRINVIGTSGVGKSTFSRQLCEALEYPLIELDRLHWNANWQESTNEVFYARLNQATKPECWVIDGNYSKCEPVKWKNATTIIWIDFSFSRTMYQATCRAINRAWTKKDIWPGTGNRETFRRTFFSFDSVLLWSLHTFYPNRSKNIQKMKNPDLGHIEFVRLRSPRECENFLERIIRARRQSLKGNDTFISG